MVSGAGGVPDSRDSMCRRWAPARSSTVGPRWGGSGPGGESSPRDDRRVLMRCRVRRVHPARPSRHVARPSSSVRRVRRKLDRKLVALAGVPKNSQVSRCQESCQVSSLASVLVSRPAGRVPPVDAGSVQNPRVHSSGASCALRKSGVRPRRAFANVEGTPTLLHPTEPHTPPPNLIPPVLPPLIPRDPRGSTVRRVALEPARDPPLRGEKEEPPWEGRVFRQTPNKAALLPARDPRRETRTRSGDGADVRQSGVHPRGASQTAPTRPKPAPRPLPARAPTAKRGGSLPKRPQKSQKKNQTNVFPHHPHTCAGHPHVAQGMDPTG